MHTRLRRTIAATTAGFLVGFGIAHVAAQAIADPTIYLDPGHKAAIRCTDGADYSIVTRDAAHIVIRCPGEPIASEPSETPNATATPTTAPTATAIPTADPTATPTVDPTPTVAPTATPAPDPTAPPVSGEIVGYGADTVGGSSATITRVESLSELRSELSASGPRNLQLVGSGVWDLGGNDLAINKPFKTVDGSGADIVFKRGSIKITASQIILRNIRSRSGDQAPVNGDDVDSITINGNQAARDHIVLDHVEGLWGPDVAGAMLGRVTDVTIQYSIFGEGLFESSHSESHDADGHSLTFNVASEDTNSSAERITFYGNLFTTSQSRQPRIIGGIAVDLIDNVFYNYAEGPQGNSHSLNLIGNTWKRGPAAADAGVPFVKLLWRYQPGGHGAFGTRLDDSVFIDDANVIGFTPATPSGDDAAVLRNSPLVAPSVSSVGSESAYQMVLAEAGAAARDAVTQRLISNVINSTGGYVNGAGYGGLQPTW